MRKLSIIALFALAAAMTPAAQGSPIMVRINGESVRFVGTAPQEIGGRVMVPLRGVLEKLGAFVDWDAASRTVMATRGETEIRLPVGSRFAYVNGQSKSLDVPAMILGGSTMVPLRFVSESLGANVAWESASQTVFIDTSRQYAHVAERTPRRGEQYYNNTDRGQGRAHRSDYTRRITINEGTVIPVRLETPLSSRDNRAGDRFSATVANSVNDAGLPVGTKVEGVVREAIAASGKDPGSLDLDFRRFVFPNGETYTMEGSLISLESKNIRRDDSGRMTASANRGGERLKWVGIGAAGGLIIGALTKQNTLTSLLLGSGLGYLYNETKGQKPGDVNLKYGSQFGIRLDRPFTFNASEQTGYQR